MSLWHLARNIADPTMGAQLLTPAGRPAEVRVIGIDGEGGGYPIFARHGEQEARSLAAELAFQLGGPSALTAFSPFNTAAACPDDATVDALLPKDTPVLILLDEVVLHTRLAGRQRGTVSGLAEALDQPLLLLSREAARTEGNLPILLAAKPWDLVLLDEGHAARRSNQG